MSQCRIHITHSIDHVDPDFWDSIPTGNPLHEHRFLQVVEHSGIEGAIYRYVLFFDGKDLVGTAAISVFRVKLDLFLGEPAVVHAIRRMWSNFLLPRVAFCGIPVSLAQRNLAWLPGYEDVVVSNLVMILEHIADLEGASVCMIKEFDADECEMRAALDRQHFVVVPSIPTMSLPITWSTPSAYLEDLRAPFRRQIKLSHRHLHDAGGRVLELATKDVDLDELYTAYLDVMSRSASKLETLTREFFLRFLDVYSDRLTVLAVETPQGITCTSILLENNDELMFLLVGKHEERDTGDSYHNVLAAIVEHAITRGFKRLRLGQTAYPAKQRFGAVAKDVYFAFRVRNRLMHWLMSKGRNVLFPATILPPLHVFHDAALDERG